MPRLTARAAIYHNSSELTKSNNARLVRYRARKQAANSSVGRLLTRAVPYRCPNVAWPDLDAGSDWGRRIILSGVAVFGGDLRLM